MKKFLFDVLIPVSIGLVAIAGIIVLRIIFTPVVIESGSMEPGLPVNTIVFIKAVDTLEPTDIITFKQDTDVRATTHTFIGYADDGSLMTKGDANETPDQHVVPLQMSDVEGKVVGSTFLFVPSYWTSVRGVLSLAIAAIMAISISIVLYRSKKGLQKENKAEKKEPLEPTRELIHETPRHISD